MQIREIMTPHVEVVEPNDNLQSAARKMRDLDVGAIPVCIGEKVLGIVTDRDIAIRCVAEGNDPKTTLVGNAMTSDVYWCYDDSNLEEAEKMLCEKQIRRILVMNRDQILVGIVSLGDIATEADKPRNTAHTLEEISRKTVPTRQAA